MTPEHMHSWNYDHIGVYTCVICGWDYMKAFEIEKTSRQFPGTLRDYFAGMALAGIIGIMGGGNPTDSFLALSSKDAYKHADAMLKERESQHNEKA